ncbi:hypothetical protein ACHABW_20380 [Salipaludibacillus sp. CF4.18]
MSQGEVKQQASVSMMKKVMGVNKVKLWTS